ncbi:MAG: hypothetical protein K2N89_13480 [Lachnospiraceae bacterium]|nr:hypothetical protein [Lachnospiraceae bacterium]
MSVAQIKVDRQSVCMGDDVTAPNEKMIDVLETDMLSDVVEKVSIYLPKMSNAVWAVDSGKEVIAYIIMDDGNNSFPYELCIQNQLFLQMRLKSLHCSYFPSYGEEIPPLEKAKYCMKERFIEKLKVNGGSLCIWGEWFGRPHDNFHIIETVQWSKDEIRIHFAGEEALYIYQPTNIINAENQLIIGDAVKVLWVWYYYGKPHVYENLYVRQYIKKADGTILRAEGKQSEISDDDGVLFQPIKEQAVCLE